MKKLTYLLAALLITSCASVPETKIPPGMRVSTESQVKDCELKGDVHGTSMFYGMFAGKAISAARQEAFEQANKIGANTIVWQPVQAQYGGTSVHGNAYKCN